MLAEKPNFAGIVTSPLMSQYLSSLYHEMARVETEYDSALEDRSYFFAAPAVLYRAKMNDGSEYSTFIVNWLRFILYKGDLTPTLEWIPKYDRVMKLGGLPVYQKRFNTLSLLASLPMQQDTMMKALFYSYPRKLKHKYPDGFGEMTTFQAQRDLTVHTIGYKLPISVVNNVREFYDKVVKGEAEEGINV